jgi:hypothetical protein
MTGELSDVIEVRDERNQQIGTGHCHINELYVSMLPRARMPNRPVSTTWAGGVHRQNGLYSLDVTMPLERMNRGSGFGG